MSLPEAAMGTQAIGSGISAGGAFAAGSQTNQIDRYNAAIAAANGQQALLTATTNAQIQGQNSTIAMGRTAAAYGAAGVQMTGSPLAVMASQAAAGELNKRLTLQTGTLQQQADQRQAAIDIAEGSEAESAGEIKAGSTLLTGVGQFTMAGKQLGWWGASSGNAGTSPAAS